MAKNKLLGNGLISCLNLFYTLGYVQSKADSTLFTKKNDTSFNVILCYVDDMIITE